MTEPDATDDDSAAVGAENEAAEEALDPALVTDGDTASDAGPKPKRFYDRGLFWLAVVIVVAGVALGASFLAEDPSPEDAAAPKDVSSFCLSAKNLSEVPTPSLEVGQPADDFRTLQQTLTALADQAPSSIAERVRAVRDSLDPVIAAAEAPGTDDPSAVANLAALLDSQSAAVAEDDAAVTVYIQKHCGFDPGAG